MNSEPDDLLSKADALMARHRPARSAGSADAEIPVLEEVVEVEAENDKPLRLHEIIAPGAVEREPVVLEAPQAELQQEQFEALAAGMRAVLLAALQPEIDKLIEARLHAGLAPLIEGLISHLRGDLQRIAHDTLRAAIQAAVERELERRSRDA